MASPITSAIGLGSGLNIADIVKVTVQADTAAKQAQITRQTNNNAAMISGIGSLRSALTTFQTAMTGLNNTSAPSFNAYIGSSANEAVVKVRSQNTAVVGNFDVVVNQLATSSKVASQRFAGGATSAISAGDLTITQGDKSYTLKVESGATLQSVRDQFNKEMSGNNLSANIVSDASGSRLVVSSTVTGAGSDISLSGIAGLEIDGTAKMVGSGAGYITALAQSAELTIDGLPVASASNTVDKAVSGVVLELTGVSAKPADGTAASATRVTVAQDNAGLKKSVQTFVDAYNTLQRAVNGLQATSKNADDNTVLGPLTNDPTTRSLMGDIRKVLAEVGSGDQLTTLSQLGINTTRNGTLEFNGPKFDAAMNDKKLASEVETLFTGSNGVFARMKGAIDPYNGADGSLAKRSANLTQNGDRLTEQQAALTRRTETLTLSLTLKFSKLDAALGKMKAQGDQITAMFSAMDAQKRASS